MNIELIEPNLKNFVKSLRDIGYTYEVAIADIIDNSITANAKNIKIFTMTEPEMILSLSDDGDGMDKNELVEAMRIATKDPDDERGKKDLGRFGLGLKTASFSQCTKLTVISKKNGEINARKWDLDYISKMNKWLLLTIDQEEYEKIPIFNELNNIDSGTIVYWENIDKYDKHTYSHEIYKLKEHLALVFHRFLDSKESPFDFIKIYLNNDRIISFNPFNVENTNTQEFSVENIYYNGKKNSITPYILPHFSKLSQIEYEKYGTDEGYVKTQGFYLYREKRLLIYGTWWGLNKINEVHKMVRIKIDISNDQDRFWGIDLKKSTAKPIKEIKEQLKNIIKVATEKGSRLYTGRGKKISEPSTIRFWDLKREDNKIKFIINKANPIYEKVLEKFEDKKLLEGYLKNLESFLPLDAILSEMLNNPKEIERSSDITESELNIILQNILSNKWNKEQVENLVKLEVFKNKEEIINEIKKQL